jgi:uncharacterized protein
MQTFARHALASAIALAFAQAAVAGTAPFFVPLTTSTAVGINSPTTTMHPTETTTPFTAPAGVSQKILTNMKEIEADPTQSTQRTTAGGFGAADSQTMWDMLAYDPSGRYIFIPHETLAGAGVSRYDAQTDKSTLVFAGDSLGLAGTPNVGTDDDWNDDFGAFDPARWTPNGTVLLGEEWSGQGRIVEVLDPMASPANPITGTPGGPVEGVDWRELNTIALVSQEGINFSQLPADSNKVIYYIDEDNSGSIYKLVLQTPGNYAGPGQTFVLKDNDNLHVANTNFNSGNNALASARTGAATWVALTDATGTPLTATNPFVPTANSFDRPGRLAADQVNGTPYGRPEDVAIGKLPNGNEIVYFTATSEQSVYSIEETAGGPMVRLFAGPATPRNVGFLPTTGTISSPDNLAIDELGNIFIIEDSPNSSRVGGDIWFGRDLNSDGVAESIDHFLSINVAGSEGTGMIFHPTDPSRFVVAIQHPTSTNLTAVPGGQGDAIVEFDLTKVVPPTCEGARSNWQTFNQATNQWVRACSSSADFNYVQQLESNGIVFPNP